MKNQGIKGSFRSYHSKHTQSQSTKNNSRVKQINTTEKLSKNNNRFPESSLRQRDISAVDSSMFRLKRLAPVKLTANDKWINRETRHLCKYSPVIVSKNNLDVISSMDSIMKHRVLTCKSLKSNDNLSGISFIRGLQSTEDPSHDSRANKDKILEKTPHPLAFDTTYLTNKTNKKIDPLIVLSGGNANKLNEEIKNGDIAWHPKKLKGQMVYLMVHKDDFTSYNQTLREHLQKYNNLELIGWEAGELSGFGVSRKAAEMFARHIPNIERFTLMDHDVVTTEDTRHSSVETTRFIEKTHKKQPVAGLGVGYPNRFEAPTSFDKSPPPDSADFKSPLQQAVSIKIDDSFSEGLYPEFMVSGGEDVLLGLTVAATKKNQKTGGLKDARIFKKALQGKPDLINKYWNETRTNTLKKLFEAEKDINVDFEGKTMTIDQLMHTFVENKWLDSHPSVESYATSSCIIERIILRYKKMELELNNLEPPPNQR